MPGQRQIAFALVSIGFFVVANFLILSSDGGAAAGASITKLNVSMSSKTDAMNKTTSNASRVMSEVALPVVPPPSRPEILNDVLPNVENLNLPREAVGEANERNYVHDPERVRRNAGASQFKADANDCPSTFFISSDALAKVARTLKPAPGRGGNVTLFCATYTHRKNHAERIKTLVQTWAKDCDGYMAASDKTDESIGAVHILHKGLESWNNMWQKVRSTWAYIHDHYADKFDWFFIGGDDIFLVAENLRFLLSSQPVLDAGGVDGKPLYLGRPFRQVVGSDGKNGPKCGGVFNLGGPGYVLNRAALKLLVSKLETPICQPDATSFAEDLNVNSCLRKHGIHAPTNLTRDETGAELFNPFNVGTHFSMQAKGPKDWYRNCALDLRFGDACCSKRAVSYHYMPVESIRRLYAGIHGHCASVQQPREPTNMLWKLAFGSK